MTVSSNLLVNSEICLKMAAGGLFKVSKDPVMVCLRCPLCDKLVREATTVSECLHTFCRVCIYQHLDDDEEENECCPVCNVNLGCSPLEKLRADRQLDDIIGKLFPGKTMKRKFIDESVDDATVPSKRKERSLSSLGMGCVPSSILGLTDPNANSMTDTTSDTETDNDSEGRKSTVIKREVMSENERDDAPEPANLETIEMKDSPESINEDSEVKILRKLEQLASSRKSEQSRERDTVKPGRGYGRSSPHDKQSRGSGNANMTKENGSAPRTRRPRRSLEVRDFPIAFAVVRERSNKNMKRRSALSQLAEIAIGQTDNRTDHVKPSTEERVACNNGKKIAEAEKSNQQLREKTSKSPSPAHNSVQYLSKTNQSYHLKNTEKQEKQDTGFWFVLQAENALSGTSSLPQIPGRYIRMKDGKVPLSIVKKYLVEKLRLKSDNEVEITCRGQSIVANLPLENVQAIWITNMDLHSTKERNRPEDYMMVLNYRRKLTHM